MVVDEVEVVDEAVPEWVAEMSDPVAVVEASPEMEEEATEVVVVDTVEVVDSEVTAVDSTLVVPPSHPLLPVVLLGGRHCLPSTPPDTPIPIPFLCSI